MKTSFFKGTRLSRIPTDAEQATGLEKKEYDAIVAGVEVCIPLNTSITKLLNVLLS